MPSKLQALDINMCGKHCCCPSESHSLRGVVTIRTDYYGTKG